MTENNLPTWRCPSCDLLIDYSEEIRARGCKMCMEARQEGLYARRDAKGFVQWRTLHSYTGLREKLAKFLHEDIWAHWMKYFFNNCGPYIASPDQSHFGPDQVLTIYPGKEQRWRRQMETAYEDLEPQEKKSDQELADKLMQLLEEDM